MNRRNLIAALAVLPFAGLLFKSARSRLIAVREELMPGLWGWQHTHPWLAMDIVPDFTWGALIVKGFNKRNNRELGFAITANDIKDKRHRAMLNPCLIKLVECLEQKDDLLTPKSLWTTLDAYA